jgi:TRAP-type C4-dicarboxylate transport system permease small subunit
MQGFAHVVQKLSRVFALAGGLVLAALSLLVMISVCGRVVFGRPVPGDFEIVATGTAIAIFLCLPYCQLQRGNLIVDLFLSRWSPRVVAWLDVTAALLLGLLSLLFAWRMSWGLRDALVYEDVSIILGFPLWWAYPFAVASFLLLACACVVTAAEEFAERMS